MELKKRILNFSIFYKINLIRWQLIHLYWNLIWFFLKKSKEKWKRVELPNITIGVVTYVNRYDNFFKPLIEKLSISFPNNQIIVCVNGYYDEKIQKTYLEKISSYVNQFENVKLVEFERPQSLSKLWNILVNKSLTTKTLILNDDINISNNFSKNIVDSKINEMLFTLINRSWSHFLISKDIFKTVGHFDEGFPGVGNEDEDYETRMKFKNINVVNTKLSGLRNISFQTKDFSYGQNVEVSNKKYSKPNQDYFNSKWLLCSKKEEGSKFVEILNCYVKKNIRNV